MSDQTKTTAVDLCSDCPPANYPTDKTRCSDCPRSVRHCADCRHFHKGYRLQGMKVPSFCNAGFCSVSHDDPACKDFAEKDEDDAG